MIASVLYWGSRINLVISILAHVKMPPPLGQICMFDMLGRLGSTIGEDLTFVLFTLLFATSLQDIHVESWIPRILLISAFLNYAYKSRFDTKSMERSFLEAVRESLFSLSSPPLIIHHHTGLKIETQRQFESACRGLPQKLSFFSALSLTPCSVDCTYFELETFC